MSQAKGADGCALCHRGKIIRNLEEIAFHQWTDKGKVSCRVTIPIGICDNCGARIWDKETELTVEQAVKREYDKLP